MEAKPRLMLKKEDYDEGMRLLGWAKFNLYKGNIPATQTLLDKAIVALGGDSWIEEDMDLYVGRKGAD